MYNLSQNLVKKTRYILVLFAFVFVSSSVVAQASSNDNTVTGTEDVIYSFKLSDFDYTGANPIAGLEITSISGNGTLFHDANSNNAFDSGEDITLFPFNIPLANIPLLKYLPLLNDNGTAVASFEFRCYDNLFNYGNTSTETINLTPVNDAPTAGSSSVNCNENSNYTFAVTHFNYNDVDVEPFSLHLITIPANGKLWRDLNSNGQIDGSELVYATGDNIPEAVITAGYFRFKPADDENDVTNGAPYATFEFYLTDGTANSANETITINVDARNSEPSFTGGANVTVVEDAGAQTIPWASAMNPGASDESAQILTFHVSNNLNTLFAVQPDIDPITGNLTFEPAPDASGVATVTVYLTDDGGTSNVEDDDTSPSQTFTITVTSVNDKPTASDNSRNCFENHAVNFAATHFGYVDVDGDPLNQILIVDAPNDGTLWIDTNDDGLPDESALTDGAVVPAVAINSGRLKFRPVDNENGVSYTTFQFKVHDGTVYCDATYTMTINVTAVNSEPSFTSGGNITVMEDAGAQTFPAWAAPVNPGASDESTQVLTFHVTNNLNSLFTVQPDIDEATGNLTFEPAPNENGVAIVTAYLTDNGGTANGGDNTSATVVFTITVTSENDPPTAADNTINCIENHTVTFANPQFGYTDVDADALNQIEITNAPAFGTLWVDTNGDGLPDEGALTSGAVVSATDINSGLLKFVPVEDKNGTPYTSFQFKVHDGTVYSNAAYTMTIDVTPINSEPFFTVGPNQVINEDAGAQIVNNWATGISAGAPDETGQLLNFVITNNTNPLLFAVPPAVSPTGELTYTPAANASGTASIDIYLHDNGGTTNGGDDTSPTQTFTITINPVNDPPTAADNTIFCYENTFRTFLPGMFSYSDNELNPFSQLEITTTVGLGTLWLDTDGDGVIDPLETILSGGSVVSIANLNAGFLKFRPVEHENSDPAVYTSFTFRVHDGTDYSVLPAYTMELVVRDVNSQPAFNCGVDQSFPEDAGAQTIAGWATGITAGAPDEEPSVQNLTFNILTNDNPGLFVTQPTIDATTGNLTFQSAPNISGEANITINLTDDGGVANGGINTSTSCSFKIIITDVNDLPILVDNNPLNIDENSMANVVSSALLLVTDDDNATNEIVYTLTSLPAEGTLFLGATPLAMNGTFTQADIDANNIHYNHNGGEVATDNFTFTVSDGNGGTIPNTVFNINIAPINDLPTFTSTPITTGQEGVPYNYSITTTDPDGTFPLAIAEVIMPAWATFTNNGNGTAVITGTPPAGAPANNPVTITVSDHIAPAVTQTFNIMLTTGVVANAGPDDETCNNNTYTLKASPAPTGYTGTWSVIDGNGTFSNSNAPNAIVSNMNNGVPPNNANTYRWTLTNNGGGQTIYDDVVVINNSVSASVTDITGICGTDAVLQANAALQPGETGIWTVEGTPIPMPVIDNPNNRTTPVHGLNFNTNQFRWTVNKGSCSAFAVMDIDVIEVTATAGGPGEICSEPFTIVANDPTLLDPAATGVWTVAQGLGSFANATDPTTTVTGSAENVPNEYVWTVSVNGCEAQASVVIENNIPTPAVITTPSPTVSCNGNATISALPVDPTNPNETGHWTCATPGVVIAQPNNPTTSVTNLQEGANLFTWHVKNGTCPEITADVTINYYNVTTVDAGDNQTLCSDAFSLAATPLGVDETGMWTFVTGGTGATIVTPTNSVTQVIDLPTGLNVLQWEVRQGGAGSNGCAQTDQIELTNLSVDAEILTTSPAVVCTDTSQLITANNPATQDIANPSLAATGTWAVVSGGSTIDNPNYFETTFSNLDEGINKYTWTVTNGQCSDVATITLINNIPTQADAGRDTTVCSTTLDNLHGNQYKPYETGFWRVIAADAILTNSTQANTSVTDLDFYCIDASPDWWAHEPTINIFEWVIQREAYGVVCESTDQVEVINGLPRYINAGLDQTVCENVVNLDAIDEASCAQEHWWVQIPDVGDFEDPFTGEFIADNNHNMPYNVHVNTIQDGMTQFVWNLQNTFFDSQGNPIVCTLTDVVEITSLGLQEDVDAGQNNVICDDKYILNATAANSVWPSSGYDVFGQWSITHGHGYFDQATSNSTLVTGLGYDTNIFRWTVHNITEGCISTDDVYIHNALPSAAQVGPDREVCDRYTVISANNPPRASNKWWTVYTGGGTITGETCANYFCTAQIDNMADGENAFVWHVNTVYTGPIVPYTATNPYTCELTDTIRIINNRVTASAGADIYVCADTAQLLATPVEGATGYWLTPVGTFASNGGITSTKHNDVIRGLTKGQNTLTWRVQKGICPASDDVVVWNMLPPTPYANTDQTNCSSSAKLSASPNNLPLAQPNINSYYHAYWSANGTATIQTPTAYNTEVHGIPEQAGTYFIWHTLNDFDDGNETHQCELKDTVYIYNNSVTAEAGSDLPIQCGVWGVGADFKLNANPQYDGVWTGIPAPGATITQPTSHNTTVIGALDGDHVYQWTVSLTTNGVTCSDDDIVKVPVRIPTTSIVSPNYLEICEDEVPLQANKPFSGVGTWSEVTTGGATILVTNTNVTTAVNVSRNGNSIFRWTIDRDGCTSEDEIVVENNTVLADADTRIDEDAILHTVSQNDSAVCVNEYLLAANDPNIFNIGSAPFPQGVWTWSPGTVTLDNPSLYNTTARNLYSLGDNTTRLTWTIKKGNCVEASRLDIINNIFTIDADVNTDPNELETCDGTITMDGEQPGANPGDNGLWEVVSNGGNIITPTLYNTQIQDVPKPYGVYSWTVRRAGCEASDQVTVYNNSVTSNAGVGFPVCVSTATMPGTAPAADETGEWTAIIGGATVVIPSLYNSEVNNLAQGQNRFRWRITKGNCDADDFVEIINNEPNDFIVEGNKEACSPNTTISVNPAPDYDNEYGEWTVDIGGPETSISTITAINANVTGMQPGINRFIWTVTRGSCTKDGSIVVTNNQVIPDAGSNDDICSDVYTLNAANPATSYTLLGEGVWSQTMGSGATFDNNTLYNTTVRNLSVGQNTFRWTLTEGSCTEYEEVSIFNNSLEAFASDRVVCTNTVTLDGNMPINADEGEWTTIASSGTPVIVTSLSGTTIVNNLGAGQNTFKWTLRNDKGCSDEIEISVNNASFTTSAGPDDEVCSTDYVLNGTDHGSGYTGYWTVPGGTATVTNSTLYNSPVTGLSPGDNVFRWNVESDLYGCTAIGEVTIKNNNPSIAKIVTPAPADREVCVNSANIEAIEPVHGTGTWTCLIPGVTFDNSTSYQTVVRNLGTGANEITWTVSKEGQCFSSETISIINNQVAATAGSDQPICDDNTYLNADDPSVNYPNQGVGHWINSTANSAVIVNSLLPGTEVTNIPIGTTVFKWRVEKGECYAEDNVAITNNSVIAAASDIEECGGTFILNGNDPNSFGGTGLWTHVGGGEGDILNPTDPNSQVIDVPDGVSTSLNWHINNDKGCDDDIQITLTNKNFAVSAGSPVTVCSSTAQLNAQPPADGETGLWTRLNGSGIFTENTLYNTTVTGIGQGTSEYQWKVSNDKCTNKASVLVTNNAPSTALIISPTDTETCDGTVTLEANAPTPLYGTGHWTRTTGAGMYIGTTNNNYVISYTGLAPGNNIFLWTIENGICPPSVDQITIVNNEVVAVVGQGETICDNFTNLSATAVADIPPAQGIGYWENISGNAAQVVNSLLNTTLVTDLPHGNTTFRWTVEKGGCSKVADVTVNNQSVKAIASDVEGCGSDIQLNAIDPSSFGTGFWDIVAGPGKLTNSTLYNTEITELLGGSTSTLVWTVTRKAVNGIECEDSKTITVTNNGFSVEAGVDETICDDEWQANATAPGSAGKGWWELRAGSGTFTPSDSNTSYVTGIGKGTNKFRWYVERNGCTIYDDITITNDSPSEALITGPLNTETCDGTKILTARDPSPHADDYYWDISTGGGHFTTSIINTFLIEAIDMTPGNNKFKWVVKNGTCPPSVDEIIIVNNEVASVAGDPQDICEDFTNLDATAVADMPPGQGTGHWINDSGNGAVIVNSLLNTTAVNNLPTGITEFTWIVEKGSCVEKSTVKINNVGIEAKAYDAAECDGDIEIKANDPYSLGGRGWWTVLVGGGTITASTSNNTTITGVPSNTTSTLIWTVEKGQCSDSDVITVTNNGFTIDAGPNLTECGDEFVMNAEAPGTAGTGLWTVTGGSSTVVFENTLHNTTVTNVAPGSTTFQWFVTRNGCTAVDNMTITNGNPSKPEAGNDKDICGNSTILSAVNPGDFKGVWTHENGSAVFSNSTNYITSVSGLNNGPNILRWTLKNKDTNCKLWDEVIVTDNSFTVTAGPDRAICEDHVFLDGEDSSQGVGVWSIITGSAGVNIINKTLYNTEVTDLDKGPNVFRWTVKGKCNADADVEITNAAPFDAEILNPVDEYELCDEVLPIEARDISGNSGETGVWSIVSGSGIIANSLLDKPNASISELSAGNVELAWTVSKTLKGRECKSEDKITIVNNRVVAEAGDDVPTCTPKASLSAGILNIGETGLWTYPAGGGLVTIVSPSTPNTTVEDLASGVNTFAWTVSKGGCSSTDQVVVENNSVVAIASDKEECGGTFILDGNNPSLIGNGNGSEKASGEWTFTATGGQGTITWPSSYNATVTGIPKGTSRGLKWTVSKGNCSDSKTITVTNNGFNLNAGTDVEGCYDSYTFGADQPGENGTGEWTNPVGGGTVSNPTLYNSEVVGLNHDLNMFTWTVTRGKCTETANVSITNNNPTQAVITAPMPGFRHICENYTTIQANDPGADGGTGLWSGASNIIFDNSTSYLTTVEDLDPGENTFTWTISKKGCESSADITIVNDEVVADAGMAPDKVCENYVSLNAVDPGSLYPNQGTGSWTNVGSGNAIVVNSLQNNSLVTNLKLGINKFRWTVRLNDCSASDDVEIDNRSVNPVANDKEYCSEDNKYLTAVAPGPEEDGYWTSYTGGVTYAASTLYNSEVFGLVPGNNTFVWTLTNGTCTETKAVTITSIKPYANAGTKQELCENYTYLAGHELVTGSGTWTVINGHGDFANSTDNGTYVSNINQGSNIYRWTVNDRGCEAHDDVVVVNNLPSVYAGPDQPRCDDYATLAGTPPGPGETGVWVQQNGIPAIITNSTLFNTTVTGLSNGANTFKWTITNTAKDCSNSDMVVITYNELIPDAGRSDPVCNGVADLIATDPYPATGEWTSLGLGTFDNPSMYSTTVRGLADGPNTLRWTVKYKGCEEYDEIVIENNEVFAGAGDDKPVCSSTVTLTANGSAKGKWTNIGGDGYIVSSTDFITQVTGLSPGANVFRWTVTEGDCKSYDEVTITNHEILSINAGVDRDICDSQVKLAALAPQNGYTGEWSVIAGGGRFDASTLYNTVVKGLVQGDNKLSWKLDNGYCDKTDEVIITNRMPTTVIVSPDEEICTSTYTLVGTNPTHSDIEDKNEWGLWTKEYGAQGNILTPSMPTSVVTDIGAGTNTFRWSISNKYCTSSADILITNNSITTDAGIDDKICSNTVVLSANNPFPATGVWSVVNSGGSPHIVSSANYTTTVENLASGANTFLWEVTNGKCPAWDIVTIVNNIPTTADAGDPETVCDGTVTLKGNNPTVGTGFWEPLGGSGTILNPSNYNSVVTGLGTGGNTFRWTVTQGKCKSYDDVTITNDLVYASAGFGDEVCTDSYPELNGNEPDFAHGETGYWTAIGGTGVFTHSTLYNTGVTGLSQGDNTFVWTVSRGECSNSAEVVITNNVPSTASVSSDKPICDNYTTISGNPATSGTGTWSLLAGNGDFDDSTANTTVVRNVGPGINQYMWTITKGGCSANAVVTITNNSVDAIVGDSISVCGNETYLNGNEPGNGESGKWTRISGTGWVVSSTLYNSKVTGLNRGENKFRWTISNGKCPDYADIVVTNNLYIANANVAGPTVICNDYADLIGNIPVAGATGTWTVEAGSGEFGDKNNPSTRIDGLLPGENTIRWSIDKNGCIGSDDIQITSYKVEAYAGDDQISCGNPVELVANNLYDGQTGFWEKITGAGDIETTSSNQTIVRNLGNGINVFRWMVKEDKHNCYAYDDVEVAENSFNTSAGLNKTVCDSITTLKGADPSPGTGRWSIVGSPGVEFTTPTANVTTVTGLQDNSINTFRWTVTKKGCTAFDEVIIKNDLIKAKAGGDIPTCTPNAVLGAQNPSPGVGHWDITSGGGSVTTPSYHASEVTGLAQGVNTLVWTVQHKSCPSQDVVIVTNNMVNASAGEDQVLCSGETYLSGDQPEEGGHGKWTVVAGPGHVENKTLFNSHVTNLQRGLNTLRWSVSQNGCKSINFVTITNNSFNAYAGEDELLAPMSTATNLTATLPSGGTGSWSIILGNGYIVEPTLSTSEVNSMPTGENTFRWTVESNDCESYDDVTITVRNFEPYAGEDRPTCADSLKLNARDENSSNQFWTLIEGEGEFDERTDPKTWVRDIGPGDNIYRWTVTMNGYTDYDEVTITNNSFEIDAGDDASSCQNEYVLDAQMPGIGGTGEWTIVGATSGGVFEHNTLHDTRVYNINPGTNRFRWEVNWRGCSDADTVAITWTRPPIAQFDATPEAFCAPDTVVFENTSYWYPEQTPPDTFFWYTEDEQFATTGPGQTQVSKFFDNTTAMDMIRTVRLVAINTETNCRDTASREIRVWARPEINFEVSPIISEYPDATIDIINHEVPQEPENFFWTFSDATQPWVYNILQEEHVKSFDYTFDTWGNYEIALMVESANGCQYTKTDSVFILPPCPYSSAENNNAKGCEDLTVKFTASVVFAESYHWDFGDGSESVEENPSHTYTEPGTYYSRLTASGQGCNDVLIRVDTITVYPEPVSDFRVEPREVMVPNQPIHLYNYSEHGVRYEWDFGDTVSFELEPLHYYKEEGVYDISLQVWSENDCYAVSSIERAVYAIAEGMITFPNAFTPDPTGSKGGHYPCGEDFKDQAKDNDIFHPIYTNVLDYKLEIYNRWGEKIFESNDVCVGWDGYIDGKLAVQDVYVYKATGRYKTGGVFKKVGNLTLLR